MSRVTTKPTGFYPEKWWRPRDRRGPICGYVLDDLECRKRGAHWCEPRAVRVRKFFRLLLVHTKGPYARKRFELTDWQYNDIIAPLFGEVVWSSEWQRYVRRYSVAYIVVARKNGKLLRLSTPIATPSGWTTMGELAEGDTVFATDGTPTRVGWVSEPEVEPSYLVRFADGAEVVAGGEHQWLVNDRIRRGKRVVTTDELRETLISGARGDRRYTVDVPGAIECPDAELSISPWLLGYWLGNGTRRAGTLTVGGWRGECDLNAVTTTLDRLGEVYRVGVGAQPMRSQVGVRGLVARLAALGVLGEKRIPACYMFASTTQRTDLLAGLLDSDGTASSTAAVPRVEYGCSDKVLAHDVLMLVRSLGYKATIKERSTASGRTGYRVCFTAYNEDAPFTLERKNRNLPARPDRAPRSLTNAIVSIEPTGMAEPMRCIGVDHPTHTYLAGEAFTPTHNSELAAGILLYLLVGDDEESAEIYGAAKDTKQAGKVFEPAWRMTQLSPKLSKRLKLNKHARRIYDEKSSSHYEIITADALGELGHNPHGFCLDEVLSQPDDTLWNAMRTAAGAREQPLLLCCTTETNLPNSFGAKMIDEAEKIQEDPARAPHIFSYVRKTPKDVDPWDEKNWRWANPALGEFLSIEALRQEALEAKLDPSKENSFRQFRLNQRVSQVSRYITLDLWKSCTREVAPTPEWVAEKLEGQRCYGGLDLSAISDLTSWCLLGEDGWAWWRYWITEATFDDLTPLIPKLAQWKRDGWLTVTEGDVIDYERVYADIREDGKRFNIVRACYDKWSAEPARQRIDSENKFELFESQTSYDRMSQPMKELKRILKAHELGHGGNPVSAWHADGMDAKSPPDDPDKIRPVKPDRGKHDKRNDGMITLLLAIDARVRFPEPKKSRPRAAWA